jgi:hypothetical protein
MKQGNLVLSTLGTVLLTGFVFSHAGWLSTRQTNHAAHRSQPSTVNHSEDPLSSEAGRRWQNCQPNHWRMYMLQH